MNLTVLGLWHLGSVTSACAARYFDVTGLEAIFDSVPHFKGHSQEIIHMTRCLLGDEYQFAWVPATSAEGAPKS